MVHFITMYIIWPTPSHVPFSWKCLYSHICTQLSTFHTGDTNLITVYIQVIGLVLGYFVTFSYGSQCEALLKMPNTLLATYLIGYLLERNPEKDGCLLLCLLTNVVLVYKDEKQVDNCIRQKRQTSPGTLKA